MRREVYEYTCCTGQILSSEHLDTIFKSLKQNGSANYDALLTGYVGDPNFLLKLAEIARDIKSTNPHSSFLDCDPVIGDNGKIYVPEELIPIYKEKILTVADVLMPNQFEAELLTGCKITDEHSALNCIDTLHSTYRIPTIIFTSTEVPFVDEQGNPLLATYISHQPKLVEERKCRQFDGDCALKAQRVRALFPKLNATFFGTGDLFSSLTLIYFEKQNGRFDMAKVLYKIQCTIQAILRRTLEHAKRLESDPTNTMEKVDRFELRLIQSACDILNPPELPSVQVASI
ncbi:unnamed protein product [Hymenolepis diminuta]|uniref:Pyridoxal kinase n=1 Tax=Hymenolepis diminuta TaxID=6216 RepID=A0A0R3SQU5_HYMDI|nr:unnamed protein product [Hymenolepis diminuta]